MLQSNRGRTVLPEKFNPIRFSTPWNFQLWLFFSCHSSIQKYKQFLLNRLALNKIHFPNRFEKRGNISILNLKETDRKHQKKFSICYGFSHITEQWWNFVGIFQTTKKPRYKIRPQISNLFLCRTFRYLLSSPKYELRISGSGKPSYLDHKLWIKSFKHNSFFFHFCHLI